MGGGVCRLTSVQFSPQEAEGSLVHSLDLMPQDAFGCLLSFYKTLSCPWKEEPLLGCPAMQQGLRPLQPHFCRVPWPLRISPEAQGVQPSLITCFVIVSPRNALLAPFSGALMPVHSGHTVPSEVRSRDTSAGQQVTIRPQPLLWPWPAPPHQGLNLTPGHQVS